MNERHEEKEISSYGEIQPREWYSRGDLKLDDITGDSVESLVSDPSAILLVSNTEGIQYLGCSLLNAGLRNKLICLHDLPSESHYIDPLDLAQRLELPAASLPAYDLPNLPLVRFIDDPMYNNYGIDITTLHEFGLPRRINHMNISTLDDVTLLSGFRFSGRHPDYAAEICNRFTGLVKKVAWELGKSLPPNIEVYDLISNGYFGLIKAASLKSLENDIPFSYYAWPSVSSAIFDYLRRTNSLSEFSRKKLTAIKRFSEEFIESNQRIPSNQEIIHGCNLTEAEYSTLMTSKEHPLSLDDDSKGRSSLRGVLSDHTIKSPTEVFSSTHHSSEIERALSYLTPYEQEIIILHFYNGLTLEKIGQMKGRVKATIHYNIAKALENLRTIIHQPEFSSK